MSPLTMTATGTVVALLVALVLLYLSGSAPPPAATSTPTSVSGILATLPGLSPTTTPTLTTAITSTTRPSATATTAFSTPLPATRSQSTRVNDGYPTFSTTHGMVTPAFQNFSGTLISTSSQHVLIAAWQAGQVRTLCVESRAFRPQFQLIPPAGAPTSSELSDAITACIFDYLALTTGDYVLVISAPDGTTGNYQLTITAYGACAPQLPLAVVTSDESVLLRERPTQFSRGVGTAAPNQCFAIVGQSQNGDYWKFQTSDGMTGWIVANTVRAVGTTDSIPVLNE